MTNGNDSVNFVPDKIDGMGVTIWGSEGLTKREYFAAMILQGLFATTHNARDKIEAAVINADALIIELNKGVE